MDRTLMSLAAAAGLVAFSALPAQAQTGSGSFGLNASWFNPGTLAEGPQMDRFAFDETFGPGAELEFWFGDSKRWGLGFQGAWSGWNEWDTNFNNGDFGHPVSMWQYDGSLQFRLVTPDANSRFVPFLSAGIGGVTVNPDDEESLGGASEFDFEEADVRLDTDTHTELAYTGGVGFDFFLKRNLALRLQWKTYYTPSSPYRTLGGANHDGGHNQIIAAGLNFYWGGEDLEEPGFIREEPEIAPRPRPEPEPEPEPVTETVSMCVVQSDGDISTVTTTRYVDTDRLVVDRNGTEVTFDRAYPATGPVYVSGETWYVRDEPLTVRLSDEDMIEKISVDTEDSEIAHLEFVRFGSASTMSAGNLVYVGSIDGTPVYVTRSEIGTMESKFRTALRTENDLDVILQNDAELARDFADVRRAYVAVEPGCVFQPISLTTYVRATRG